jgi:Helix-turn-helix.
MPLTIGEKIKIALKRRNMTLAQLADTIGQSRQNLSNKMTRDNFSEKEIIEIANALNCTYANTLTFNDTGETL